MEIRKRREVKGGRWSGGITERRGKKDGKLLRRQAEERKED